MGATPAPASDEKLTLRCHFCQTWNRVLAAKAADRPKCGNCGRPLLLDRPYILIDEAFDRTIAESDLPVLVDFFADWCGPCHMIAPHLDAIASDRVGKALVLKVDTEADPALASRFAIRGLPTVVAFRDGKEVGRQVGAAPREVYEKLLGA